MDRLLCFICWCAHCLAKREWYARVDASFPFSAAEPLAGLLGYGFHFVERPPGVKTTSCPKVARLCPLFVLALSIFGQILSRCDLPRAGTFRSGSQQTGETVVKSEGNSGAAVSLVRSVPVHAASPRARATFGTGYDSGSADQVQCFQFWRQKCADHREVDAVQRGERGKSEGALKRGLNRGRQERRSGYYARTISEIESPGSFECIISVLNGDISY